MGALRDGILAALMVWMLGYAWGSMRDTDKATAIKPDDLISFTTPTATEDIVNTVLLFGRTSALRVESRDEAIGKIVLGQNPNLMQNHNGYWLLVYVSDNGNGTTTVEIGIKPKVGRVGSKLPKIRDRAVSSIKAMVMGEGNNKA